MNELKNAIVKLIIKGTEEELKQVDMATVRENLKSAYSLTVQYDIARKDLVRDVRVTEDMDDEHLLVKYIDEHKENLTNQEKQVVFDLGKEVILQAKEKR